MVETFVFQEPYYSKRQNVQRCKVNSAEDRGWLHGQSGVKPWQASGRGHRRGTLYLDPFHHRLQKRNIVIPEIFTKFQGYKDHVKQHINNLILLTHSVKFA